MNKFKIEGNRVITAPPTKPKKITGTRLAAILGANRWSTPFEAWCAITRLYEKPFEGSIYTEAGKTIEPKITAYLRDRYFMDDLKTPEDVYGEDFFKKTWGDFYHDTKIFGGMWDALGDDYIVEVKTTKRAEDWKPEPPLYYMLQGALYAWLKGFDRVIMVCAFLEEDDYKAPENFVPSVKNTILYEFSIEERFPNFADDYINTSVMWWEKYVETGESPEFDEKADAEILKALRTNQIEADPEAKAKNAVSKQDRKLDDVVAEYELICEDVDRLRERYGIDKLEKLRDELKDQIKQFLTAAFRESDKKATFESGRTVYTVTKKAGSESVDAKKLKKEEPEIFAKYVKVGKPTFALSTTEKKEEEK